ncbi:MAG: hypothetical protein DME24_03295, partial [Verrucomicrobia bacterium]
GGHEIQLHTHPDLMYDPKRQSMHEYSLAEQTTIIRDGMALLREWTGKAPIAHRAGSYGANKDTLKALHANGIFLDSSFFYRHGNCRLPFANLNSPFKADGIWEVPVTVHPRPVRRLGISLPFVKRYGKLDVNWMSGPQLCKAIEQLHGTIPYIVTFLHSFSFTRRQANGFVPDEAAIASFQAMLQLLAENNIPAASFEQIDAKHLETYAEAQPSASPRES